MRWVCGFANAQGGRLLLGVNDKGVVVGLPDAAKLLEDLPNKVRDLLGLVVEVNLLAENGLPYLELVVQAYPNLPGAACSAARGGAERAGAPGLPGDRAGPDTGG